MREVEAAKVISVVLTRDLRARAPAKNKLPVFRKLDDCGVWCPSVSKICVRCEENRTEIYLLTIYVNSAVQPNDPPRHT